MIKNKNEIIDKIVFEKRNLTNDLSQEEKKEIDIYFEELLKELSPALDIFDMMSTDETVLENITDAFKQEIKEQQWLEKLSKTFYDQEDIQALIKTRLE
jgi:uncharacterized protein (DUF2384 family)